MCFGLKQLYHQKNLELAHILFYVGFYISDYSKLLLVLRFLELTISKCLFLIFYREDNEETALKKNTEKSNSVDGKCKCTT